MSGIFISYRREDSAGHSGRLFDRLRERFGKDHVFMDVSAIEPGVDFVEAIDSAVGSCDALIVVIGRKWLSCTDAAGNRRLDDPKDFIRLETAAALRREIRVIPVLIQDAAMPAEKDLPEDLLKLARRQAIEISDGHWESDTEALIEALIKVLPGGAKPSPGEKHPEPSSSITPAPKKNRLTWLISTITAVVVALGALLSTIDPVKNTVSRLFSSPPEKRIETTAPSPAQTSAPQVTVVVPNLIGISLDAAVAQLRLKRLEPGSVRSRPTNRSPGMVMEQEPVAGTRLEPGSQVHIVIAEKPAAPEMRPEPEPEPVVVPQLAGLPLEKARAALKKAGLVMGKIKQVESRDAKPGTVIEQAPPSGRAIATGDAVTLVVAIEPKTPTLVTVPKLGGLSVEMAHETLAREGLTAGTLHKKVYDRSRPGTVIDQKPRPGQQVAKGTAVELVLATSSAETRRMAAPKTSKVTVIAQGEPTNRRFWERENKPAYSAKIARLYSSILKGLASDSIELSIDTNSAREMRVLEKMLRDPKRLCESTGSDIVYAARAQEPFASSDVESAYWPELRQTAIVCNSGKQYEQRNHLSPEQTDKFPFEKGITEAMQKFAGEYRHLLK